MPPPHGGVATNMLAIHEALRRLGHRATILDVINRSGRAASPDVLKPRSAFELVQMLLRSDCDIVHYHIGGEFGLKLALLTLFCGLLPGKRSVVTFHSGGYASRAVETASAWSLRGVAFRSVDLLIGVNRQMMEMFRRFGVDPRGTRLILPFELKRPDPATPVPEELKKFADRSRPFLLSVGALEPEYLNAFLIEAMPRIVERFPDAGLMIVGSGGLEAKLKSEIRSAGLEDRVSLPGNLEHSVVLHLIERADTLLRLTQYDGDSVAVREALFLGTQTIASDNVERPDGVVLLRFPPDADGLLEALDTRAKPQFQGQSRAAEERSNAELVVEAYMSLVEG